MAEQVWTTGKLTAVYMSVGRRENGERRYRRAQFDMLSWAPTAGGVESVFILPLSYLTVDGTQIDFISQDIEVGHEFGFYQLGQIVVEPHQGDGLQDTLTSLHMFGPV